jgi:hypothetical protein
LKRKSELRIEIWKNQNEMAQQTKEVRNRVEGETVEEGNIISCCVVVSNGSI